MTVARAEWGKCFALTLCFTLSLAAAQSATWLHISYPNIADNFLISFPVLLKQ